MFAALATLVRRYPRYLLALWTVLPLLALPFAGRVGEVLTAQAGVVPGSSGARVGELLSAEFGGQDQSLLVLITRSAASKVGTPGFDGDYAKLAAALQALPGVSSVQDYRNPAGLNLIGPDRSYAVSLLTLAQSVDERRTLGAIDGVLGAATMFTYNLSGGAAVKRELETVSERDARRAELFGLPLSLIVLTVAFGALVAAGLPLLVAAVSVTLSYALLFLIGQWFPFSVFTQTIVTMLGLATGIDYALLMVNRFREELEHSVTARDAAAATVLTAGKAVAFSGFTVMIALSALLVPPLDFIRSIGLGAMVVLLVGVLVAVTALPALLALLGTRVNAGKLTRRIPGQRSRAFWSRRARLVQRHPLRWALGGTLLLILLGLPALRIVLADPGSEGLSPATDARQVQGALEETGLAGVLDSFTAVLDFGEGGFFNPTAVRATSQFSRQAANIAEIAQVFSPTTAGGLPSLLVSGYYATRETALASPLAELVAETVSQNGRYVLIRLFPQGDLPLAAVRGVEESLTALAGDLGVAVTVGGNLVREREWTRALYQSFPLAVALVYCATLILLGLAFRSLLIPIKSIVLNTLTVGAAFGIITLIFQYGVGVSLFGLPEALGYVDSSTPIFVFAIVFGLSMDYEIFLVARVYEAHLRGYSDKEAVAEALGATGGVISSAGLIMIVVFSAFIASQIVLIKTLALGLAIAIFLDITLVRLALVPAVMSLAGAWNWWLPRPLRRLSERLDMHHGEVHANSVGPGDVHRGQGRGSTER